MSAGAPSPDAGGAAAGGGPTTEAVAPVPNWPGLSARSRWWERAFYRFVWLVLRGFSKLFWRLTIEGSQHLPTSGAYILAPVHRSNIDFLVAGISPRRRVRFMAKHTLWKASWGAWFLNVCGAFPVRREATDREAIRTAEQVLELGQPLVMFPEGQRRSGPVVEELYDGTAFLACRARVPVVPVGIGGSEAAMPKGSKLIKPVRVSVVIGEPIVPPVAAEGRVPRRVVREVSEQLQADIQRLFDQAQRRAGSA